MFATLVLSTRETERRRAGLGTSAEDICGRAACVALVGRRGSEEGWIGGEGFWRDGRKVEGGEHPSRLVAPPL